MKKSIFIFLSIFFMFCLVSCDVTYTKTEISESSFSSSYADSPIVGKWICQSIKENYEYQKRVPSNPYIDDSYIDIKDTGDFELWIDEDTIFTGSWSNEENKGDDGIEYNIDILDKENYSGYMNLKKENLEIFSGQSMDVLEVVIDHEASYSKTTTIYTFYIADEWRDTFENRLNILNGPKSEEEAIDNLQEYDSLYLRENCKGFICNYISDIDYSNVSAVLQNNDTLEDAYYHVILQGTFKAYDEYDVFIGLKRFDVTADIYVKTGTIDKEVSIR